MIDPQKLLEKCLKWRQEFAHAQLAQGPNLPMNAEAYARGTYSGVLRVEGWIQEIVNEAEKEEKNRG